MAAKHSRTNFDPVLQGSAWPISEAAQVANTPEFFQELLGTLLEDRIGRGVSREVFSLVGSETLVAKVERPGLGHWANIMEFRAWNDLKGTWLEPWLAPCRALSLGGALLIQARTSPLPYSMYPEKVPDAFTDLKPENFGLFEGRVVCHDYAITNLFERGAKGKAMQKSGWR